MHTSGPRPPVSSRSSARRFGQAGAADPAAAAELLLGPVLHRWLLRSGDFDREWVQRHIDRVLLGAQVH